VGEPLTLCACPADETSTFIPTDVVGCAFQVGNRAYMIVGNHWIIGSSWHCLEDLQTGKRYDVMFQMFNEALNDPEDTRVKRLNEMETLAWTAR
jgi:hypothetical protein